jgi:hypothetical protein
MKTKELSGNFSNSKVGDTVYWIDTNSFSIGYGDYMKFPIKVGTDKISRLSPKCTVVEFENHTYSTRHIYTTEEEFNVALVYLKSNIHTIIKKAVKKVCDYGSFTYHLSRLNADLTGLEDELYNLALKRLTWLSDLHL